MRPRKRHRWLWLLACLGAASCLGHGPDPIHEEAVIAPPVTVSDEVGADAQEVLGEALLLGQLDLYVDLIATRGMRVSRAMREMDSDLPTKEKLLALLSSPSTTASDDTLTLSVRGLADESCPALADVAMSDRHDGTALWLAPGECLEVETRNAGPSAAAVQIMALSPSSQEQVSSPTRLRVPAGSAETIILKGSVSETAAIVVISEPLIDLGGVLAPLPHWDNLFLQIAFNEHLRSLVAPPTNPAWRSTVVKYAPSDVIEEKFREGSPAIAPAASSGLRAFVGRFAEAHKEPTAALFYSVEAERLAVTYIDTTGAVEQVTVKVDASTVESLLNDLRHFFAGALATPDNRGTQPFAEIEMAPRTKNINARVTNILIPAPLREKLSAQKHLVIVPSGKIGAVPFAALEPFEKGRPLILDMTVSVAPSSFDLIAPTQAWSGRFVSPLVLGDPAHPEGLSRLPGAKSEALAVAKAVGTKALTGAGATRSNFVDRAPQSDLIYIAAHGIADPDNPLKNSYLALAGQAPFDARLSALKVLGMDLGGTKLAVLSACQTGLGLTHPAGIIGLARAFQVAGTRRVVMSLWNVNDEVTAHLMTAFTKKLARHPPAQALRMAMVETRARWSAPAFWASFVLMGTPR